MDEQVISDDVKRFILTSVPSIPHLEALLLLHNECQQAWDVVNLSQRLYIPETKIQEILSDLVGAGFLSVKDGSIVLYSYTPISQRHREIADRVTEFYVKNLIEVTNLVHSKEQTKIQKFADAFRLRKE